MGRVVAALVQASEHTIECAGLEWRIQGVTTDDLAKLRIAQLRIITPEMVTGADSKSEEDRAADRLRAIQRVGEKDVETMNRYTLAVICAGTTGVRQPGGDWDPLTLVMDQAAEDVDGGVLHISRIAKHVRDALFAGIEAVDSDGGAAAERLAAFLEVPGRVPDAGCGGA